MERQIRRQYTADYRAQAVSLSESLGAAGELPPISQTPR